MGKVTQKQIQEALDRRREERTFPEAWKPEKEGDVIAGTLKTTRSGSREDGTTARVLVIDTGDKSLAIWESATLSEQMDELTDRLVEGAYVACSFDGESKSKRTKRTCKLYTLTVV